MCISSLFRRKSFWSVESWCEMLFERLENLYCAVCAVHQMTKTAGLFSIIYLICRFDLTIIEISHLVSTYPTCFNFTKGLFSLKKKNLFEVASTFIKASFHSAFESVTPINNIRKQTQIHIHFWGVRVCGLHITNPIDMIYIG